jgi:hypothetical protein
MGDLGPTLAAKQMRDVVLPGTHDSGTYSLNPSIAGSKLHRAGPMPFTSSTLRSTLERRL